MPIYEYHCNACGKEFEKMVRWSEVALSPVCPQCASQDTKKKLSTIAALGADFAQSNSAAASSCGSSGGFR